MSPVIPQTHTQNHFQNLITLSEDAQWDCARHITTLMADPSATVPTPKIITEFLEQCMAVKSVVIDSNELTQDVSVFLETERNLTLFFSVPTNNVPRTKMNRRQQIKKINSHKAVEIFWSAEEDVIQSSTLFNKKTVPREPQRLQ